MLLNNVRLLSVVLLILHLLGIYLFTSGFLLTRYELPTRNNHTVRPDEHSHKDIGWMQPQYKKAIIVIIDALRFDFALYDDSLSEEDTAPYQNKLTSIRDAMNNEPKYARLFQFIADPPTVTMQRLKGLMTGGIPTFIDIANNFDTSAIKEDNIIDQLYAQNKNIIFMGDDTWSQLFPHQFNKSYPFPSFNVKDLHTVDDGVISELMPILNNNNNNDDDDWDVLIAHFLGVDHVGHRYSPLHNAMSDKLIQMNNIINELITYVKKQQQESNDDDTSTLLLILGDHGMTQSGNHGGSLSSEVQSTLFSYSSIPIFPSFPVPLRDGISLSSSISIVPQIGLVPTLSLLLGIAIPHGNVGLLIPEFFMSELTNDDNDADVIKRIEGLCRLNEALNLNAKQVLNYLNEYQELTNVFTASDMNMLMNMKIDSFTLFSNILIYENNHFTVNLTYYQQNDENSYQLPATLSKLQSNHNILNINHNINNILYNVEQDLYELARMQQILLTTAHNLCVEKWTKFNINSMVIGIIIILISILMALYIILIKNKVFFIIGRFYSILSLVLMFIYMQGLFSNSFIIAEENVVLFLFGVTLVFLQQKQSKKQYIYIIILLILNRFLGRGESIRSDFTLHNLSDTILTIISVLLLYILLLHIWHNQNNNKNNNNQNNNNQNGIIYIYMPLCLVGTVYYWMSQDASSSSTVSSTLFSLYFPRCLYLCSFTISITSIMKQNNNNIYFIILMMLLPVLLLSFGPHSPLLLLILLIIILLLYQLKKHNNNNNNNDKNQNNSTIIFIILLFFFSIRAFFATGHNNTFSSLKVSSAFVGFDHFNMLLGGPLVVINTFSSYICTTIVLPMLISHKNNSNYYILLFGLLYAIRALLSAINALLQRRHLMVWAIFAPKYVFDVCSLIVVDVCIVFILLIMKK